MTAPAVEARDLTVRFGDFTAVDDVTFRVAPGEIFGFLGANGAGKTTTIRVLCGLLDAGFDGFIRVGSLRKMDVRVLPHRCARRPPPYCRPGHAVAGLR